jgi:hypothetical protein
VRARATQDLTGADGSPVALHHTTLRRGIAETGGIEWTPLRKIRRSRACHFAPGVHRAAAVRSPDPRWWRCVAGSGKTVESGGHCVGIAVHGG